MRAWIVDHYGKDGLRLGEMRKPDIQDHDVLVQVHAAGINQLDYKVRGGAFKQILPYKPPFILGHDVAGVVLAVGSLVERFKPGDEIYARPADYRIGTFAEFIAVHENDVALKPESLTMIEAAAVPLVALTAWQALVEKAGLQKGQKVFIQAGSGGVGTFAIQLAKHLGATVATTTSAANIDLVKSLGADVVIDYKKDDFETLLHDYDVVLNSQDTKSLEKSLRVLKPGGILISISGPPDPTFAKDVGLSWILRQAIRMLSAQVRRKAARRSVRYSFLFMKASGDQLRELSQLISAGIIQPVIDRVFPFDATADALAYIEKGRAMGKVVVNVK